MTQNGQTIMPPAVHPVLPPRQTDLAVRNALIIVSPNPYPCWCYPSTIKSTKGKIPSDGASIISKPVIIQLPEFYFWRLPSSYPPSINFTISHSIRNKACIIGYIVFCFPQTRFLSNVLPTAPSHSDILSYTHSGMGRHWFGLGYSVARFYCC